MHILIVLVHELKLTSVIIKIKLKKNSLINAVTYIIAKCYDLQTHLNLTSTLVV